MKWFIHLNLRNSISAVLMKKEIRVNVYFRLYLKIDIEWEKCVKGANLNNLNLLYRSKVYCVLQKCKNVSLEKYKKF